MKLEQLERLRSEDTPRRLMTTHTIESNFLILKRALHATHLLKLLDKMCKYEMDPMSIVEDTDGRTDGQTDVEAGGIIITFTLSQNNLLSCYLIIGIQPVQHQFRLASAHPLQQLWPISQMIFTPKQ